MTDTQNEVLQRVVRVETKVDSMDEKLDRALTVTEMAVEARASASSAHKRLDKIEDNQKWMWRTMVGAFLVAVASFIIGGGLKP